MTRQQSRCQYPLLQRYVLTLIETICLKEVSCQCNVWNSFKIIEIWKWNIIYSPKKSPMTATVLNSLAISSSSAPFSSPGSVVMMSIIDAIWGGYLQESGILNREAMMTVLSCRSHSIKKDGSDASTFNFLQFTCLISNSSHLLLVIFMGLHHRQ